MLRSHTQFAYLAALLLWSASAWANIATTVNELVENHRRLVVLLEKSPPHLQGEARRAGHYLFVRNQHLIRELVGEVRGNGDVAIANVGAGAGIVATTVTVAQRYREFTREAARAARLEGDQLALRGPFQALVQADLLGPPDREDARERLTAIGDIRRRFGADVTDTNDAARINKNAAKAPRPLWDAYVQSVSAEISAERVIARLDADIFGAFPDAGDFSEAAARARFLEWDGTELPPRSVLLTFDDGPHATHTARVLDILKTHNVKAIFYMVGRNLGAVRDGVAAPGVNSELVRRMVAEGHAVGNHSYTHAVMPKLDNGHLRQEIEDTQLLINAMVPAATPQVEHTARTRTLRFPYGARNDRVLAEADGHRLRSVMWNIDSLDWADPVPESIVQRVLREFEKVGRGILLMHDIHARTVDALSRVIALLKARGYVFLKWDGAKLVADAPVEMPPGEQGAK